MSKRFGLSVLPVALLVGALLDAGPILCAQTSTSQRGVTPLTSSPLPSQQKHGAYYALVIGIKNYPPGGFDKLATPLNDANEIATVLQYRYGFQTRLLPDAKRDQIMDALDDYCGSLRGDDSLLIYYAGHGWYDKEADDAYWIPVDGQPDKKSHWINATDITGAAMAIHARHVLIISDSCYSGRLAGRDVRPTIGDPLARDALLEKVLQRKSRHIMSSGGDEPVADGDAPGHSSNSFRRASGECR